MNTKRANMKISIFILILILGLLVTACQPQIAEDASPQNTPASEAPDDSVPADDASANMPESAPAETVSSDIEIDPALASDAETMLLASYLFETLLDMDGNPVLATSWTVSDDQLDYIFELESGVSFHDGTVFNADAVILNFNRWFAGEDDYPVWVDSFGGYKGEVDADGKPLSIFDGIEKVDELTVLIHLNQPDPNLLANLATPAFAMLIPSATDNAKVAGTGSYHITSWTTDNFTLAPFDGYWSTPAAGEEILFEFE